MSSLLKFNFFHNKDINKLISGIEVSKKYCIYYSDSNNLDKSVFISFKLFKDDDYIFKAALKQVKGKNCLFVHFHFLNFFIESDKKLLKFIKKILKIIDWNKFSMVEKIHYIIKIMKIYDKTENQFFKDVDCVRVVYGIERYHISEIDLSKVSIETFDNDIDKDEYNDYERYNDRVHFIETVKQPRYVVVAQKRITDDNKPVLRKERILKIDKIRVLKIDYQILNEHIQNNIFLEEIMLYDKQFINWDSLFVAERVYRILQIIKFVRKKVGFRKITIFRNAHILLVNFSIDESIGYKIKNVSLKKFIIKQNNVESVNPIITNSIITNNELLLKTIKKI